jgi:ketopantoate reductase
MKPSDGTQPMTIPLSQDLHRGRWRDWRLACRRPGTGWLPGGHAGAWPDTGRAATRWPAAAQRSTGRTERIQVHPVQASDSTAALGVQDLVIVAVKAPAMRAVALQIAPLMHAHTVVLCAMNGVPWWFLQDFGGAAAGLSGWTVVDPGGDIQANDAPASIIVGCVVHASCVSGGTRAWCSHGFGNVPHHWASLPVYAAIRLLALAGLAAARRLRGVTVSDRIQRDIWFKLWGNMTMNPISALTGATSDRILDDPLVRGFCAQVMLEARQIGAGSASRSTRSPKTATPSRASWALQDLDAAGCGSRQGGGTRCAGGAVRELGH